jgi:hypothetical protein
LEDRVTVTQTHPPRTATATRLLTPRVDDLQRSWERQRALRLGEDAGWYTYLAGDPVLGHYVLQLPDGRVRVLTRDVLLRATGAEYRRDEPLAWVAGQAYGHGNPQLLERIGPLPRLYDRPRVSELLGMTKPTVNAHTRSGRLRALYYARHRRHYFADQIDAMRGDPAAGQRWELLRFQLPNTIRPDQITYREAPPPRPLPVPEVPRDLAGERNMHALRLAEQYGWLRFVAGNRNTYTITIDNVELEVPAFGVLPFVWGLGDARGQGDRVAYR